MACCTAGAPISSAIGSFAISLHEQQLSLWRAPPPTQALQSQGPITRAGEMQESTS